MDLDELGHAERTPAVTSVPLTCPSRRRPLGMLRRLGEGLHLRQPHK